MKFKKVNIDLPEIKQVNESTGRKYVSENGKSYPSVTTVLSVVDKGHIEAWKAAVGEAEASRVSHHATTQGSIVHDEIEKYILNRKGKSLMPHTAMLYKKLKECVDKSLSEVYVTEAMMMSDHLKTAGTVDCIGVWDGKLSVIDWKTAKTPRDRNEITNYFMQEAFYAVAFEENTGIPIPQLVTVMTCETGCVKVFIEKRDEWINEFIKIRDLYKEKHESNN